MKEIRFELTTPIKYTHQGEDTDGNFITLNEPSLDLLIKLSIYKSAFYSAAARVADDDVQETGTDKEQATGEQIMSLLYMECPNMPELLKQAKSLFVTQGVASVEGVVDMTSPILKMMTIDDFERMLGEYLVNFILASALNQKS